MSFAKASVTLGSEAACRLAEGLRQEATRRGLTRLGIASPDRLPPRRVLEDWLAQGRHAGIAYLARHLETRLDPRRLLSSLGSIVSVAIPYFMPDPPDSSVIGPWREVRVARYAWGEDYHQVLGRKLRELLGWIEREVPGVEGRVAVDTTPLLERHWAVQAGLGWIGRNGNLIVPGMGSWVFLGEILLDLPLPPDDAMQWRCGACRRCVDACPGAALFESEPMDARRCISYWTIEHRGPFPDEGRPRAAPWLFGCDVCLEVCPHNRHAPPATEPLWAAVPEWVSWDRETWQGLTAAEFEREFSRTPLARAGFKGIRRNLEALEREAGGPGPESAPGHSG